MIVEDQIAFDLETVEEVPNRKRKVPELQKLQLVADLIQGKTKNFVALASRTPTINKPFEMESTDHRFIERSTFSMRSKNSEFFPSDTKTPFFLMDP